MQQLAKTYQVFEHTFKVPMKKVLKDFLYANDFSINRKPPHLTTLANTNTTGGIFLSPVKHLEITN